VTENEFELWHEFLDDSKNNVFNMINHETQNIIHAKDVVLLRKNIRTQLIYVCSFVDVICGETFSIINQGICYGTFLNIQLETGKKLLFEIYKQ
jgi:hypothetical protein